MDLKKAISELKKLNDQLRMSATMIREIYEVYDEIIHMKVGEHVYIGSLENVAGYAKWIFDSYGETEIAYNYLNRVELVTHFNKDPQKTKAIVELFMEFESKFKPVPADSEMNKQLLNKLFSGTSALTMETNGFKNAIILYNQIVQKIANNDFSLSAFVSKMKKTSSLPLHRSESYSCFEIINDKTMIQNNIGTYISTVESNTRNKENKLSSSDIPVITQLLDILDDFLIDPTHPLKHKNLKDKTY